MRRVGDTIAAIATPPGEGGLGVVRLSGPDALALARGVFEPLPPVLRSRHLYLGHVVEPRDRARLDQAFLAWFKAPRSYTAEDLVELQCHGSPRVLARLLDNLVALGARRAERGEFTERAFLNGRLDLTQAEGILDLISAQTDVGLREAGAHLDGALRAEVDRLRDDLLALLGQTEVNLDFVEDDVPVFRRGDLLDRAARLDTRLSDLVASYESGVRLRQGFRVVLAGRANTGKSSLFNRLVGHERVLVDAAPGTTRDWIEERVEFSGLPLRLVDTAGFRAGGGEVESAGQLNASRLLAEADLVVLVLDRSERASPDDAATASRVEAQRLLPVLNKSDLPSRITDADLSFLKRVPPTEVSALTGDGLGTLQGRIAGTLRTRFKPPRPDGVLLARERHRDLMARAQGALRNSMQEMQVGSPLEIVALPLYDALHALDELLGKGAPDEVLNRIFGDFCIGK